VPSPDDTRALIRHGTPEFRRVTLAFFFAGFATFALLYCVQPLMPVFADVFGVSPAASSLPLSLTTGILAPAMIVAGSISEVRGRKVIMIASLTASAVLTILAAAAPTWTTLLVVRALAGVTFAGLPAVSMAYLSEEMDSGSIGLAVGLMIGGNGIGGMLGRIGAAFIADSFGWRVAVASVGVVGLIAALVFWRLLPPSRHFTPRQLRVSELLGTFREHLRNRRLAPLLTLGFLLMGSFVTAYNYVTFRLLAPPYSLSHAVVGSIFVVYLLGIFAAAGAGSLAGRVGRAKMLATMIVVMMTGVALMALRPVVAVIAGIAIVTIGYFGAHSVASTWVSLRATYAKAQASAVYFFLFYFGSSVAGSIGGVFWGRWGWGGVIGFLLAMLATAFGMVALAVTSETA
jgi:YNFM family putative membrane transporter